MTTEFINNLKEKTKTAKENLEIDVITEISRHDSDLMKEMEKAAEQGHNVVNVKYKLPTKYEVIKDKLKFILISYYNRPDLEIRVEIIDSIIMFGYDITIVW